MGYTRQTEKLVRQRTQDKENRETGNIGYTRKKNKAKTIQRNW